MTRYSENQKGCIYRWREKHADQYHALHRKYSQKRNMYKKICREFARLGDLYLSSLKKKEAQKGSARLSGAGF